MQRLASAAVLTRLRTALGRAPIPAHKVLVRMDRALDTARHRSLSSVADELCRVAPAHISVDVFDTVLTR